MLAPAPLRSALVTCLLVTACSGSGSGSGSGGTGPGATAPAPPLAVLAVDAQDQDGWALNRPVRVLFDRAVDPTSVGQNTLRIERVGGLLTGPVPAGTPGGPLGGGLSATGPDLALGTWTQEAPDELVFTPACPADGAATAAGLSAASEYHLVVPGQDQGGPTLLAVGGGAVATTTRVGFRTVVGADPHDLWDDGPGFPEPFLRPVGGTQPGGTRIRVGDEVTHVERDPVTGNELLPANFLLPLNRYAHPEERVTFVVAFDSGLVPTPENLAHVGLEYADAGGTWRPFLTERVGSASCRATEVELTALGILPQGSGVRVRVRAGLTDLGGDVLPVDRLVATTPVGIRFAPGTSQPGEAGDGLFDALLGDRWIDTESPLPYPRALHADGRLVANPGAVLTGGPGGDFDLHVAPGTVLVLDTTFAQVVGGPGGVPTTQQSVVNGVLEVRDLVIGNNAILKVVGPNPLTVLARGTVQVDGTLDARGGNNPGVGTLNTTNQPEPGAPGAGGGGRGGTGSPLTTASSPRGQHGFGPFDVPDAGGRGGEASFGLGGMDVRRGSGGGGGGFAPDVPYLWNGSTVSCQALVGMDGEPGFPGGPGGTGAVSGASPAQGGALGPSPFVDGDPNNDFHGAALTPGGALVAGELDAPRPGSGGGGGGDAVNSDSFPLIPFQTTGDEKGAGGGGGGGLVHVIAQEAIVVGPFGRVVADGGHGGGGENAAFFNRVGGGSGGGSGGQVLLESLVGVQVLGEGDGALPGYQDDPNAAHHWPRPISALGGQGGAGRNDLGGASASGPSAWRCDGIPVERVDLAPFGCPDGPEDVPPFSCIGCFAAVHDGLAGAGGDGAPGLVHLAVPDPATGLGFPDPDPTTACAPPPVGWTPSGWQHHPVPSIGTTSVAQTRWVPLGAARQTPGGPDEPVTFPTPGLWTLGMLTTNGQGSVTLIDPVIVNLALVLPPGVPSLGPGPDEVTLPAGVLGDVVLATDPRLLAGAELRLSSGAPVDATWQVVTGTYDEATDRVTLVTEPSATHGSLADFPLPTADLTLTPRTIRVATDGVFDALDPGAGVTVHVDATVADADGLPDLAQSLSVQNGGEWTVPDQVPAQPWDFVRLRFLVDLPTGAGGGTLDPGLPVITIEDLWLRLRF